MAEYETEVAVPVRFRDLDSENHVNNAVYVTYLEQARIEYLQEVVGRKAVESGLVAANISVDYERPILIDDDVVVALRVTNIGTSSIAMEYEIRADGTRAASAESTIVTVNRGEGTTRPVPDEWRERIEAHEGRSFD